MEDLKVTVVQVDIGWENVEANLNKYSQMLEMQQNSDVIILPEMFTTGFSMRVDQLKEKMDGATIDWMKHTAQKLDAAIVGSLIVDDKNFVYNRAVWVYPDGHVESYDKRHLYTMGQENLHYTAGKIKNIVNYKGWKFCPQICYDLRFPVFARNTEDYDILFYVANWPSPRHHVWKNLLIARAIENQSYCFGVNRIGQDGMGLNYLGDSGMVSPKGFADFLGNHEGIKTYEVSYNELHNFRKKFPLLLDRDQFTIQ